MDTCSAAREISLDNLHISTRASRIGNKHAMVPTRQGVLTAAAAESATAAAVDASAAATADAAWGAVKPTAVDDTDDAALGAVKTTAADDAEDSALGAVELTAAVGDDGLCRRTCCGHHHHDLREPLGPRFHAPGRCLAALQLWPGYGCRRHFSSLSWSPRSAARLHPVHQT